LPGVSDHGGLTGLADDDHTQYYGSGLREPAHGDLTGVTPDQHHRKYAVDEQSWRRRFFVPRGQWTKVQAASVFQKNGVADKFDDLRVMHPCVLLIDGTYKMWYTGYRNSDSKYRIGHATSPDRVTWTRVAGAGTGDSCLDLGVGGKFDDTHVWQPCVVFDGTTYHMWYTGHDGATNRIGYATSADGVAWTRQNAGNAVLDLGAGATWDDAHVMNPIVYQLGREFWMVYNGHDGAVRALGVAFCKTGDGIAWVKYSGNPVIVKGAGGTWDDANVYFIGFYWDQGVFYVVYAGYDGADWQLGMAMSSNGQVFVKYDEKPTFLVSGVAGDWDHWKQSPSILRVDTTFYMWFGGAEQGTDADEIGLASIP